MNTTLMARICNDDELIAQFGQARLLRNRDGRYELRGGTPDNHAEAREWASLFMHEAFFAPPQPPRITRGPTPGDGARAATGAPAGLGRR